MTLPPVVSDPERCPERRAMWQNTVGQVVVDDAAHEWLHPNELMDGETVVTCIYCGGRKP